MGLSFGGFVTGHYLATHPAKVRTLTLVDPVASASAIPGVLTMPLVGRWIWQVTRVPGMAEGQSSDFLHPERWPEWAALYPTVSITLAGVVKDGIPGIEYVPVDSSGHLPHVEQAALVRERMLAFLAAHPGEARTPPGTLP